MEPKKNMLKSIEHLTDQEKLELFNVEELETRLEMAAFTGVDVTQDDAESNGTCNTGCVPVEVNGNCW